MASNEVAPIQGIELDVPDAAYRKAPGFTQSLMRHLAKSPAHYKAALTAERKQTPAMRLGTLTHLSVFQPILFAETVVVGPNMDKRSTGWKQFVADNAGKEIISEDEAAAIKGMTQSVLSHSVVGELLKSGFAEVSVGFECPDTGVLCKGRLDWFMPREKVILDLKTTEDAGAEAFTKSIANHYYHWQAAHYLAMVQGIERAQQWDWSMLFVAVEKEAPFGVGLYRIHPHDLERSFGQRLQMLRVVAACQEADNWPSYPEQPECLSLPRWAFKD